MKQHYHVEQKQNAKKASESEARISILVIGATYLFEQLGEYVGKQYCYDLMIKMKKMLKVCNNQN